MNIQPLIQSNSQYRELVASPSKRKALAGVVMRVLDKWDLDTASQLTLLGLAESSRAQLTKYRNGIQAVSAGQDPLQRVGYIISIYQLLKSLYPKNDEIRKKWVKTKNPALDNYTPLEIMLMGGLPEIKRINAYLQYRMVR